MTFLPIIVINTLIGIIQELRTKRVLDRLTLLNAPKTKVIRDGKESEVDSQTLVKGDLCRFKSGNQICADAVVEKGSHISFRSLTSSSDRFTRSRI